jgi:serine-type D-Ala-D-Ala endopeptidase (penicillin-binding protein 7)
MRKQTLIKIVVGLWAVFAIVIGVSRQLVPSMMPIWDADKPKDVQPAGWVEKASYGEIKKTPKLRCASAFIVDNKAGEIILNQNANEVRPIASITKLLTSLVFLESGVDLSSTTRITNEDAFESSKSRLREGEEYTVRDMLYAALVSSDNRAARALSRSAGMSQAKFIAQMNDKARELNMDSTHVIEPTGLSNENRSTAHDCAILVNAALKNHLIRHITSCNEHTIQPLNRRRVVALSNTNRLLETDLKFLGAKTGYINDAGWCIAARALSPDGEDITAVVLGARTSNQRFSSLSNAFHWAFDVVSSAVTRN